MTHVEPPPPEEPQPPANPEPEITPVKTPDEVPPLEPGGGDPGDLRPHDAG